MTVEMWIQEQKSGIVKWYNGLSINWQTAILAFFLIGGVIGLLFCLYGFAYKVNSPYRVNLGLCLDAGYNETVKAESGWYCIGIRGGNTVTIKVEDLGQ